MIDSYGCVHQQMWITTNLDDILAISLREYDSLWLGKNNIR